MKKIQYLILITAILSNNKMLSTNYNNFLEDETELKDDAGLAKKLTTEKIAREKSFKKLIKRYTKNYYDYIKTIPSIKKTIEEMPIKEIPKENINTELISLISSLNAKKKQCTVRKEINNTFKKIQTKKEKYTLTNNREELLTAIIIEDIYEELNNKVKESAKKINPGVQDMYDSICSLKIILQQDYEDDQHNETLYVLYFFTKEHIGELKARLKEYKR